MNRRNRRLVEAPQPVHQAGKIRVELAPGHAGIGQSSEHRALLALPLKIPFPARLEGRARLAQPVANALPKFRRRGLGKGHHEYLAHRVARLDEQAQVERGDIESLARPGTGLDEPNAVEFHLGRVEFFHQVLPSRCSSKGPKTWRAKPRNPSPSSPGTGRQFAARGSCPPKARAK